MSTNIREKTPRWWICLVSLAVLCTLFGIVSGIFVEVTDDSAGNGEKPINWKKGFFRVMLVSSILFGTLAGIVIPGTIKKDDSFHSSFKSPGTKFGVWFIFILIFVWFVYFIIQWPIYSIANFMIEGFTN